MIANTISRIPHSPTPKRSSVRTTLGDTAGSFFEAPARGCLKCRQLRGLHQSVEVTMTREQIEAIRRQRDQLADQVRKSQETIARSEELIRQFDLILAEVDKAKH